MFGTLANRRRPPRPNMAALLTIGCLIFAVAACGTSSSSDHHGGGISNSTEPTVNVGAGRKLVVYKALEVTVPNSWRVVNQMTVCWAPPHTVQFYTNNKFQVETCPDVLMATIGLSIACLLGPAEESAPYPGVVAGRVGRLTVNTAEHFAYIQGHGWLEEITGGTSVNFALEAGTIYDSIRLTGHSC